ncbi:MAG: hypothetical protein WCP91_01845 [Candidatus Berkelbacteria bacterium]
MDKTIIKKVKKVLPRVSIIFGGIIIIVAILFGGIRANDYLQVNKLIKASDSSVKQEKYQEAYNSLTLTQARWTTSKIKKEIETKLTATKQLITDQSTYNQATDLFGQSKWQEAKDSYSKVSDKFTHYKEAQDKIKECQTKIDEANAQAEKDKQAEVQKAKQTSAKMSVANDPFPSLPDYSSCPPNTNPNGLSSYDYFKCTIDIAAQYQHDKEAWYARHGQTMPQAPAKTQTAPTHSSCSWIGNTWTCNAY